MHPDGMHMCEIFLICIGPERKQQQHDGNMVFITSVTFGETVSIHSDCITAPSNINVNTVCLLSSTWSPALRQLGTWSAAKCLIRDVNEQASLKMWIQQSLISIAWPT